MRVTTLWLFVCATNIAQADISINNQQLSTNNELYDISQDLGQTVGNNLFHSFDRFNLNAGEIAQFSGSAQIQNVISRVIGNEPSLINGTIRSLMPNADFYFLNPNGIVFGEFAQLQVPNSFHASTADYLKLSDGGEFHARFPERDILSIAPVSHFGFLGGTPSAIQFIDSSLTLQSQKQFSIIGGDIVIAGGRFEVPDGQVKMLSLGEGEINEIELNDPDWSLDSFNRLGNITISERGFALVVAGEQGGQILTRSQNMLLTGEYVDLVADFDRTDIADEIDLRVTGKLTIADGAQIHASTKTDDAGGTIRIDASQLEMIGGGQISADAISTGNGGNIKVTAGQIILDGLSRHLQTVFRTNIKAPASSGIFTVSIGQVADAGSSGMMSIDTDYLLIKNLAQINAATINSGNAGAIHINAKQLFIESGGGILSSTLGQGDGGSINITSDNIILANVGLINSSAFGLSTSHAGSININTGNLNLLDGGNINVSTLGFGNAGTISINAAQSIYISGQSAAEMDSIYDILNAQTGGALSQVGLKKQDVVGASGIFAAVVNAGAKAAGTIEIQAERIEMNQGATISSENRGQGDAGQIEIQANDIYLTQSTITTETQCGGGGNITLQTHQLLHLNRSQISTSVGTGIGQGGDITITNPSFSILNQSQIIAQADAGNGGNIRIIADQFLQSPKSLVSASSRLGIGGNIEITPPDETVSSGLLSLNKSFAEQAQIKDVCKAAIAGQLPTEFQQPLTLKVNMYRFQNDFVGNWIPSFTQHLNLSTCQ
ncbi:filamentous hemagglutinin N-terminal domain-containing protein [Candidatus Albibeggiatoa sp. nov. BB20]|uniref:two-partner secretion domain-containing protein n=1 Tax=Candidatus Albibeggiatoa sp. nov. BB20 TaxID=3162723 RepID=UPI0033656B87